MKKYSDKFLSELKLLEGAIVGFEFEFYMSKLSYYKTLELMNQVLSPVRVHGYRQYHSNFKPDSKNFKIEPDLSGGSSMVELVTGPMNYIEAKYYLVKILHFIGEYGYTNDKCSIHFNISFNDKCEKNLNDLNILKLILNTNEDEIYKFYPNRKGNIYAKSIKSIIPFKQYDFFNVSIDTIKNNLRLPNDKYYGINFINTLLSKEDQRLEYRYIGGKDYEKNIGGILYFFERFIIDTYKSVDVNFDTSDMEKLVEYLEDNIKKYKSFNKYENFIIMYPSIELQIDQDGGYEIVNAYFNMIYTKLYDIINAIPELKDCIVNYDTNRQVFEIVDAQLKAEMVLNSVELINCAITEGIFDSCNLHGCEINNSQVSKSSIHNSDVKQSKILSCHVDKSTLHDCYFMNGYLNCDMQGGIFRSGELGPYATISPETKIIKDEYSGFFDTRFDSDDVKFDKEGFMKGLKK